MTLVQKEVKKITMRPNGSEVQIRPVESISAGIYYNSNSGIISLSSDGTTWMTIRDKNEGATTVWNGTDARSATATFTGTFYTSSEITAPSGYHIASRTEWDNLVNIGVSLGAWTATGGVDMMVMLKMAYWGYKMSFSYQQTGVGYFWTSNIYSSGKYYQEKLSSSGIDNNSYSSSSAIACLIRAFADTPVEPDNTRTVLYQPV